jgi:hypothetical protein
MGDRAPYVVGILAIAGFVVWLVVRGDDTPAQKPPPARGSADLTASPRARIAAPEAPALPPAGAGTGPTPALPPVPPAPTADEVFAEEPRDDAWAAKTEAELAKRWKKIRAGKLESTECRQTQCRLLVTGAQTDVATAIADLEGPRGLHGFARGVHLTSPETRGDGTVALRVFVRFDR